MLDARLKASLMTSSPRRTAASAMARMSTDIATPA